MKSLLNLFRVEFDKYKELLQLITGIITLIIGISSLVGKIFESKYTIALICVGLFFIIKKIINEIIDAKKESFGVITSKYPPKLIKRAKFFNWVIYLFWVFPLVLVTDLVLAKFNSSKKGYDYINSVGLLITSFSNSDEDDFSYKLFNSLDAELQHTDTINTLRLNKFISSGSPGYLDSIKGLFDGYKFKRGILVFGKRSIESQLFECNLFLNNMLTITPTLSQGANKNIIYIQNPDMIKFSIDYQSQIVSEFILGLLYYNANDFSISRERFQNSLVLNSNKKNKKFKAYCHLFIGHSLYNSQQYPNAIKEYKTGLSYDSLNAYLHFNLGNALLANYDTSAAYHEYTKAKKIDNKLLNPIEKISLEQNKKGKPLKQDPLNTGITDAKLKKAENNIESKSNKDQVKISNLYSVVVAGNKYGIVNNNGDTIIRCEYDYIDQYVHTYGTKRFFIAKRDFKFGALTEQGRVEIPFKHDSPGAVQSILKIAMEVEASQGKVQF